MRLSATRTFVCFLALSVVAAAGGLAAPGCSLFPSDDCASHLRCSGTSDDATTAEEGGDAAAMADTAETDAPADQRSPGDGADGAAPDAEAGRDAALDAADGSDGFACDENNSPHDDPCVVGVGTNAVFVAPPAGGGSDANGNGSRSSPYATIGYALAHVGAGKDRLYICDATYAESVSLSAAVSLYGGLACPRDAGWSYVDGGVAQVNGGINQIALAINGVPGPISVEDLAVAAANASGQDDAGNGKSSIAVLVNAATVSFRRCAFTAGDGDNAGTGMTTSNHGVGTAPDGVANSGADGGEGGSIACGDGTASTGGNGGIGAIATASDGGSGGANPMPQTYPAMALDGLGGVGGFSCGQGHKGAFGAAADGGGAAAATYGSLTSTGWTPSAGGGGQAGQPGQGGGGGGGLAGALPLGGTGGGAGGCGGGAGTGGGGGGASIALACVDSTVALDGCLLTTGLGGNGGNGGDGQPGQGGGALGAPIPAGACTGGYGGNGAGGAGGAGGTGGIAVCVVYKSSAPAGAPSCVLGAAGIPGGPGQGGAGGTNALNNPAPDGGNGASGLAGIADAGLRSP
jgi:hypothetical protein